MTRSSSADNYSDNSRVGLFRQFLRLAFFLSILPAAVVAYGFYHDGRSIAEKVATAAVMPLSVIIFVLFGLGLFFIRNAKWSIGLGLVFQATVTWIGASPIISNWIMNDLESRGQSQMPTAEDQVDCVVILGGGTGMTPDLRPQFANSGDRIGLAIRLYHAGAIKKIVVTGTTLPGTEDEYTKDPSSQSKQLLIESNVDESVITTIQGINTTEELRSLKARPELWEGKRCGLITSAFHLPRAMRLAAAQGLNLIPIAADYRSTRSEFNSRQLLPSGEALNTIELAIKEHLGMLLGR